ncbi:hypothetical protein ACFX13_021911 [Malus domestica]
MFGANPAGDGGRAGALGSHTSGRSMTIPWTKPHLLTLILIRLTLLLLLLCLSPKIFKIVVFPAPLDPTRKHRSSALSARSKSSISGLESDD